MSSMIIWMMSISLSVSALVITASLRLSNPHIVLVHICVAGILSLSLAVYAIQQSLALAKAQASPAKIAASDTRSMAMVWIWAALALSATYGTGVLTWSAFLGYVVAFASLGAVCLAVASRLEAQAEQGLENPQLLSLAHHLAFTHMVMMTIVLFGFMLHGDLARFVNPRAVDWAATNIMFFGAIALLAIGGHAAIAGHADETKAPRDGTQLI